MKAIWNDVVIAQSDETTQVEGNHYFPPSAIKSEYFHPSDTTSYCPWKGEARYYSVEIEGETLKDAAWYYPEAKEKAKHIEGWVAFWNGVIVSD
ncbi:DUF427 domain-containing protein [Ferrimonas marina]|uniref:Nucleotidyltransferase n=1 Tax=Ferrimonas marina TaxID=299255 RepID=A0A1M5MJ53_9GAMM|nr:DUF427 domain-containing protein [Ferrimonas marina]SHG77514.1 Nucleotidyltransferase [Ferrimonas marina]